MLGVIVPNVHSKYASKGLLSTPDGVFELPAAEYVLVCNITEVEEDGTVESHLEKGMLTTFTVT